MNVLIVAATHSEVLPLLNLMGRQNVSGLYENLSYKKLRVDVLVTGIGMVATAFHLSRQLSAKMYDLAVNAGIAGSLPDEIRKGDVLNVSTDSFSELGAEDGNEFIPVFKMGLMQPNQFPFIKGELSATDLHADKLNLRKVKGITVNTVHGNDESITKIKQRLNPDVETMEGAAFFYCCLYDRIPCAQIRAVSNKLERRNRDNWDIDLAIRNLNRTLEKYFDILNNA